MIDDTQFITTNWTDEEGNHQGGQAYGPGFCISWQHGPLIGKDGKHRQNGAFLITVLLACLSQLKYFQESRFASEENAEALKYLEKAIAALRSRKKRRGKEGTLGTHIATAVEASGR